MKMSKRIASLLITVNMLLGMMTVFAGAAGATIKLTSQRADYFEFEYTGAEKNSWVGIYYENETPSANLDALIWISAEEGTGKGYLSNGAISDIQAGKGGARFSDAYTNLAAGNYKICLFAGSEEAANRNYNVLATAKFTVKKYDVAKDKKSTYLSDLKMVSFVNYKQTSKDLEPDKDGNKLTLEDLKGNRPFMDRQNGGFDEAVGGTGYLYYGSDETANTNVTINVGGRYYEKGVSLAIAKIEDRPDELKLKDFYGKDEKWCEAVFDVSGLDINTFSCVFGKNALGQKGNSIGGCEILADDKVIFISAAPTVDKEDSTKRVGMDKKAAINVKCEVPAGTKTITLRAYSINKGHGDGGVAFADAKVYKASSAATGDMGIAVSAIALVVAASAAAVALSKKH